MKFLQLPFAIQLHLVAALVALVLGIFILRLQKGDTRHRTLGWVWVVVMGVTALSTVFIRDYKMPNIAGYTPIHLFTVWTAITLPLAVWAARAKKIDIHRRAMKGMFFGACVVAGLFTLLPGRYMGNLLWHSVLGIY